MPRFETIWACGSASFIYVDSSPWATTATPRLQALRLSHRAHSYNLDPQVQEHTQRAVDICCKHTPVLKVRTHLPVQLLNLHVLAPRGTTVRADCAPSEEGVVIHLVDEADVPVLTFDYLTLWEKTRQPRLRCQRPVALLVAEAQHHVIRNIILDAIRLQASPGGIGNDFLDLGFPLLQFLSNVINCAVAKLLAAPVLNRLL